MELDSDVIRYWGGFASSRQTSMGQFMDRSSSSRVMFDEEGNNGLVLCDKYLPVEVLMEIFCHADCKTLMSCQLVCKRWRMLMSQVWHKKTERTLARSFPWDDEMPWHAYYLACTQKPYERNLVSNHSGSRKDGTRDWIILQNGGDNWTVEKPPVGIPEMPQTEPMFKHKQSCFATSYDYCCKIQQINLVAAGIHPYILDKYQPPIKISEWYGCRWDCPAVYKLNVSLRNSQKELIDEFDHKDILEGEKQNQWLQVSHVFKNYGTGVRYVTFEHSGKDRSFWAGHYGSKMAGACVRVKIPESSTCT